MTLHSETPDEIFVRFEINIESLPRCLVFLREGEVEVRDSRAVPLLSEADSRCRFTDLRPFLLPLETPSLHLDFLKGTRHRQQ